MQRLLITTLILIQAVSTGFSQDKKISKAEEKNIALIEAIKINDQPAAKKLIKGKADINYRDENFSTPLMWAAYKTDLHFLKYLIANGADHTLKGSIRIPNGFYGNLTSIAAGKADIEMLKYLIEELKVPVDDQEYVPYTEEESGWTALDWAVNNISRERSTEKQKEIADYLLEIKANVDFETFNIATNLIQTRKYDAAEELFALLSDHSNLHDTLHLAVLIQRGDSYAKSGKRGYDYGLQYYDKAVKFIKSNGLAQSNQAYQLNLKLARYYTKKSLFSEAIKKYEESLALINIDEISSSKLSSFLQDMRKAYRNNGQLNKWKPLYDSISDYLNVNNQKRYAGLEFQTGISLIGEGRYSEGRSCLENVLKMDVEYNSHIPKALNSLSKIPTSKSISLEELEFFSQQLFDHIPRPQDQAEYSRLVYGMVNRLGLKYVDYNRLNDAKTVYQNYLNKALPEKIKEIAVLHSDSSYSHHGYNMLNNYITVLSNSKNITDAELSNMIGLYYLREIISNNDREAIKEAVPNLSQNAFGAIGWFSENLKNEESLILFSSFDGRNNRFCKIDAIVYTQIDQQVKLVKIKNHETIRGLISNKKMELLYRNQMLNKLLWSPLAEASNFRNSKTYVGKFYPYDKLDFGEVVDPTDEISKRKKPQFQQIESLRELNKK